MADTNTILTGSLCLTDIPREQMKKVLCRDGKERIFVNIAVITKKEPQTFTNNGTPRTFTHFITCSPKKEERVEGVNYIIADLETKTFAPQTPTVEDVESAPGLTAADDLPF